MQESMDQKWVERSLFFLPLLVGFFIPLNLFTQTAPLTLFSQKNIFQQSQTQPAHRDTAHRFSASLFPVAYFGQSAPLSLSDLIIENNEGAKELQFPENILKEGEQHSLFIKNRLETFRFAWHLPKWSVHLYHASTARAFLNYPSELIALAIEGNAPFIGKSVPLNPYVNAMSYEELGAGAAVTIGNWTLGGRLKWMFGHTALYSPKSQWSLYTSGDVYQLETTLNYQLNIAGLENQELNLGLLEVDLAEDKIFYDPPIFNINWQDDLFNFSSNQGVSVDLGISWHPAPQWQLELSALDLGSIRWNELVETHTAQGTFAMTGLQPGLISVTEGNTQLDFGSLRDSLDFIPFETGNIAFSTRLPGHILFGIHHSPSSSNWNLYASAAWSNYGLTGTSSAQMGANYHKNGWQWGVNTTLSSERHLLAGMQLAVNLGAMQIYLLTNHFPAFFQLSKAEYSSVQVGINWKK